MKKITRIITVYEDGSVITHSPKTFINPESAEFKGGSQQFAENSTSELLKPTFRGLVRELGYGETVQYTTQRYQKLRKRLKTYTSEQLTQVAKAIFQDDWLQGENPQKKRYGTIDYLLRNDEVIDKYLNEEQGTGDIDLTKLEI